MTTLLWALCGAGAGTALFAGSVKAVEHFGWPDWVLLAGPLGLLALGVLIIGLASRGKKYEEDTAL